MRALLVLVLALLAACASNAPKPATPPPPTRESVASELTKKSVALVDVEELDLKRTVKPFCSGVWVDNDLILTAGHCITANDEKSTWIAYVTHDDIFAPGSLKARTNVVAHASLLLAKDAEHDLALLLTSHEPPPHSVATIDLNTPTLPGMFVQTLGTPKGQWFSYSTGDVGRVAYETRELGSMFDSIHVDALFIQATTPVSPGSSGCGLFDAQGNLLGIASHVMYSPAQGLNFFVHWQHAADLIRKHAR